MPQLIRLLRIVLIILLAGGLSTTLLIWLLLHGSLAQYTGEKHLPRLGSPVSVERDTLGSVTITGQNRLDTATALGFIHAQERFFEMDLLRRQAAGELAEIFGVAASTFDLEIRKYRMRARAKQILLQLPKAQQQILTAYRTGVNAGLNALVVRPFPYLLTRSKPRQWLEEDSLLVIFSMFITLNDTSGKRELGLSLMRAEMPDALFHFLTATGGAWDTPLIGESFKWPTIPPADVFNLRANNSEATDQPITYHEIVAGSNNFAVSGALTAHGAALVANDMHLTLRVPNLWFRTRLLFTHENGQGNTEPIDVAGISLPGAPAIIIGSNRHIAWSFTNSYGDFIDWVRITLDPNDALRYLSTTGWQPIQTFQEIIHVRQAPAITLTVQETEWGPIVANDHDGTPLTAVWTALQPGGINLKLIDLEQAQTVDQAAEIAQQTGMPPQNFIVGDKHGNILWTIAGRIPQRTGNFDPRLPADWSDPQTGWRGWVATTDYPLIRNPKSGRLWTANTRTVDADQLKILGDGGYDLGARSRQIRDNLFARDQFTADDFFAIQLDHRARFYTRWHTLLLDNLQHADKNVLYQQIEAILNNWDGNASTDSVAYRIVRSFRQEVINTLLNAFTANVRKHHPKFTLPSLNQTEHAIWQLIETQPENMLPQPYESWNQFLLACFDQTVSTLQQQSDDFTTRTWGEENAARIQHPFSQHLPQWIAKWIDMPADPLPGDVHMPQLQMPNFGASQRSVVIPGKEEQSYLDMPGGQSGHPLSPYYGSGHANWVSGKPTPLLPGDAENTLSLIP